MRGIVLAGGTGSRLWPVTIGTGKQLLPIYDKPMIYYPVSSLIRMGIQEILIISDPVNIEPIQRLLRDGAQWGVEFRYAVQEKPAGIGEAFRYVPEDWHEAKDSKRPFVLILGDNLFGDVPMPDYFQRMLDHPDKAVTFLSYVKDPERYGVAVLNESGEVERLVEKPKEFLSPWASVGLYKFPANALSRWKDLEPSPRGELEVVDLLNSYIGDGRLESLILPHGTAWLDSGTFESLSDAGEYVRVIQARQGRLMGSPEMEAYRQAFITAERVREIGTRLSKSTYGENLLDEINRLEGAASRTLPRSG